MRIVVLTSWFSEKMGYAENCLPRALGKSGHDVHVVTSDAQVYFDHPDFDKLYGAFLGSRTVACGEKAYDGFTLHRLPQVFRKGIFIPTLEETLARLNPEILQTFSINEPATIQAAHFAAKAGTRFFTGCHVHLSTLSRTGFHCLAFLARRLANHLRPSLRTVNAITRRCYAIAPDTAEVAIRLYKVPAAKVRVQSLGVDTRLFHPVENSADREARTVLRKSLDVASDEILCIYSGRFSETKNPFCLATAIQQLRAEGRRVRGLFIGNGPEEQRQRLLLDGCIVLPFVPNHELGDYYRAADIGVWPREESTSQLDVLSCGLPVVLSNRVTVTERVNGCGLTYEEGSVESMQTTLVKLFDSQIRERLGIFGHSLVERNYSWDYIASERIKDYLSL